MADLCGGNVDPDAADEGNNAVLIKYRFPQFDSIKHFPGDDVRPSVVHTLNRVGAELLRRLKPRMHDMFCRGSQDLDGSYLRFR
jgi:hypothetical protein